VRHISTRFRRQNAHGIVDGTSLTTYATIVERDLPSMCWRDVIYYCLTFQPCKMFP
jgi:hypothetical protein